MPHGLCAPRLQSFFFSGGMRLNDVDIIYRNLSLFHMYTCIFLWQYIGTWYVYTKIFTITYRNLNDSGTQKYLVSTRLTSKCNTSTFGSNLVSETPTKNIKPTSESFEGVLKFESTPLSCFLCIQLLYIYIYGKFHVYMYRYLCIEKMFLSLCINW